MVMDRHVILYRLCMFVTPSFMYHMHLLNDRHVCPFPFQMPSQRHSFLRKARSLIPKRAWLKRWRGMKETATVKADQEPPRATGLQAVLKPRVVGRCWAGARARWR